MLTISKMYRTLKKYEMDYYYLGKNAPEIAFRGKLAERLGLTNISGGAFECITAGKNAIGETLVRPGISGFHNPGRDIVLSPDKSVAISCYLSQNKDDRMKIINAHREAVKCITVYIEKELILARINHGSGGTERISTGNMLYTEFEHNTSRESDPQLHTHLIIFNMTRLPGDRIRAMENRNIYDCRKLLCRIYENQLCRNLRSKGFDATITKEGYASIPGVSKDLIDIFSKRTVNMKERLTGYFNSKGMDPTEEISKGNTRGLENSIMLYTRKPKKAEDLGRLINNWKSELSGAGKSLKDIPRSRNINLLKNNYGISPEIYIRKAIDEITANRGFFSKKDILSHSLNLSKAEIDIRNLEKAFHNNGDLLILDKQIRIGCGYHTAYTTPAMIELEKNNLSRVLNLRQRFIPEFKEDEAGRLAADFCLTKEQTTILRELLLSNDRMDLLKCGKDTGCDFILPAVVRAFSEKGYEVVLISPDSRMARSLETDLNIEALSPDRFLSQNRIENGEKTLYIADRLDLIGPAKIGNIMEKADNPFSKIICTGKLYSTGREAGRDFRNFCNAFNKFTEGENIANHKKYLRITSEELSKLHEFSLIESENIISRLEKKGSVIKSFNTYEVLDSIRKDYLKDPQNTVVITRSWREKNDLNRFIRSGLEKGGTVTNLAIIPVRSGDIFHGQVSLKKEFLNYEEGLKIKALSNFRGMKKGETGTIIGIDPDNPVVKVAVDFSSRIVFINPRMDYKKYRAEELRETTFGTGDRIVFLKSSVENGIKRGEQAVIEKIENNEIKAVLENQCSITIDYKNYNYFDHAYAASGPYFHSGQGKNTLLDLRVPNDRKKDFGSELENSLRNIKPGTRIYTNNIDYVKNTMEKINLSRAILSYKIDRERTIEIMKSENREYQAIKYELLNERRQSLQMEIGM